MRTGEAIPRAVATDVETNDMMKALVLNGKVEPGDTVAIVGAGPIGTGRAKLVTHQFALGDIMKAYDTFGNAAQERALKVILTTGGGGASG